MISAARRNFAFDTIDDIACQTSLPQLADRFAHAMAKLGFTSLGINGLPPPKPDADPIVTTEFAPEGFRDCYSHERIYLINPTVSRARTTFEPFRFSDALHSQAQSPSRERFTHFLRSYGMDEGLVVPVGRPANIPTCVWLAGKSPETHDEAIQVTQLISLFVASKVHALSQPSGPGEMVLTSREREVLAWAAQGKSAWEIGQILHIAKRTVDEHTQIAARKLGAANKTQAVALALLRHMIEL